MAKGLVYILNGQVIKDLMSRHGRFLAFLFLLALIYISMLFGIKGTKRDIEKNEKTIKELRSEYLGKYTKLQYQSRRGEIEKNLQRASSQVKAPTTPPVIIIIDE